MDSKLQQTITDCVKTLSWVVMTTPEEMFVFTKVRQVLLMLMDNAKLINSSSFEIARQIYLTVSYKSFIYYIKNNIIIILYHSLYCYKNLHSFQLLDKLNFNFIFGFYCSVKLLVKLYYSNYSDTNHVNEQESGDRTIQGKGQQIHLSQSVEQDIEIENKTFQCGPLSNQVYLSSHTLSHYSFNLRLTFEVLPG